jgi:glycosyltransferase involved in cell wall biosynthesis
MNERYNVKRYKMSRRIRVLHVLKSSSYSGAENVVITIIKHLNENYEAAYLATRGEIEDVLREEGICYFLLDKLTRKNISKIIEEYKPDIVHAHDFTATVLCAMILGKFRLISHLHYDPPWVYNWNIRTIVYQCCKKRISKVLTVSTDMFQNMVFANKFKEKVIVVKNPLDVERIKQKADDKQYDNLLAIDIIFVGRFVEQKNPQRFIRLVETLKREGFDKLHCIMLGDGKLLEECRRMVKSLGLEENVQLLGFQGNPYAYINKSSLLCLTSRWEGFGLVIAEASILGVPVLSTKTSGACEILGEKAWEICDSDVEFVDKAKQLLTDHIQYEIKSEEAVDRARRFCDMEVYMSYIVSIYKEEV